MKIAIYHIIRYRPNLAFEEFVNIGLLVHTPFDNSKEVKFLENLTKLKNAFPSFNEKGLGKVLKNFSNSFNSHYDSSTSLANDFSSYFPNEEGPIFLSNEKKSLIPESEIAIDYLFQSYFPKADKEVERNKPRANTQILKVFMSILKQYKVWDKLQHHTVEINDELKIEFKRSWQNGIWHSYEVLALKGDANSDYEKIFTWRGKIDALVATGKEMRVAFFTLNEEKGLNSVEFAKKIFLNNELNGCLKVELYTTDEAETFAIQEKELMNLCSY